MTIDLKWAMPIVMPFFVLVFIRVIWWAAGAEWSEPAFAAFSSAILGFSGGVIAIVNMSERNIKWTVKIGGRG